MEKKITLLDIEVSQDSLTSILEKIKKNIEQKTGFSHIMSLNPEILVTSTKNPAFKTVLQQSDLRINDGSGIVLGVLFKYLRIVPRVHGVDLFTELMKYAGEHSLTVLLLGGKGNLAKELAECYQTKYSRSHFIGLEGFENIQKPKNEEQKCINSIVVDARPHIIFAAFGSPYQELWFWENKRLLQGSICMGVGGGFDFLSGRISRAPKVLRLLGLEWLFRLIMQPSRWRRQLKLLIFMKLVFFDFFKR